MIEVTKNNPFRLDDGVYRVEVCGSNWTVSRIISANGDETPRAIVLAMVGAVAIATAFLCVAASPLIALGWVVDKVECRKPYEIK